MGDRGRLVVTVVLLALYVVLFGVMVAMSDDASGETWTRMTYLFGSAEAVAFAGVGWVFGREVHRDRAVQAEKRASQSEDKAAHAQTRAEDAGLAAERARSDAERALERGQLLAEAVRVGVRSDTDEDLIAGDAGAGETLLALANRLFPPGIN